MFAAQSINSLLPVPRQVQLATNCQCNARTVLLVLVSHEIKGCCSLQPLVLLLHQKLKCSPVRSPKGQGSTLSLHSKPLTSEAAQLTSCRFRALRCPPHQHCPKPLPPTHQLLQTSGQTRWLPKTARDTTACVTESQGRTEKGDLLWQGNGVKMTHATQLPEKPELTAYKQGHAQQRGQAVPRCAGVPPAVTQRAGQGKQGGNTDCTAGRGWFRSRWLLLQ